MSKYDDYKVLRNKVRKFTALSIIFICIKKLHEISKKPVFEETAYLPWELLYLIKIGFLEGGKNGEKVAVINDVNGMLNQLKELGSDSPFLGMGTAGGLRKFMRTLAFQQFWVQRGLSNYDLARQVVIFNDCTAWNDEFEAITGIPIRTYLQLLVASWTRFLEKSNTVTLTPNWFVTLGYPAGTIDSFLDTVSLPFDATGEYIEKHYEKTEDKLLQLTEQTPLKQYPFLQVGSDYYCYSPYVLQDRAKHVIYDLLKATHKNVFTQSFGELFENYIYRLLDECGAKYIEEEALRNIFPKKRVCDAIVEVGDMLILLEIKGVEMHPYSQINPTNAEMTKALKTNIIKSFEQLYEVANLLHNCEEGRRICRDKELFALVVTYKEMYLSDGKDSWDEFLAEPLQEYLDDKKLDISYLLLERIHFASVATFENIIKILLAGGNLPAIFNQAVADNSDLIVAEISAKLVSNEPFAHDATTTYKTLANKGENYKEFWNVIKTHHRPLVFRRQHDTFQPLIDISRDDLIINRLTVSSPPDITITGIGTAITDLYYAAEREERNRQGE